MKISKLPKDCDRRDETLVRENVAENIRIARESVGLTQIEMARMIGWKSATALSLIESGDRGIPIGKLWLISDITGNRVDNFFLKGLITPKADKGGEKKEE